MQVIGNTVFNNLQKIAEHEGGKNDRMLQKSMVGNLHQWLVDQQDEFLQDFNEFNSINSFNRGSHNRRFSDLDGINSMQNSFDQEPNSMLRQPKSVRNSAVRNFDKGFLMGPKSPFSTIDRKKQNKSVFQVENLKIQTLENDNVTAASS